MSDILQDLRDADRRGISPPQNWTTRAADEIEKLRNTRPDSKPSYKWADHVAWLQGLNPSQRETADRPGNGLIWFYAARERKEG